MKAFVEFGHKNILHEILFLIKNSKLDKKFTIRGLFSFCWPILL